MQEKTAFVDLTGPSYTSHVAQQNAKREAFKQLMRLAGLGAAFGGGARALVGVNDLVHDTQSPVSHHVAPPPVTIHGRDEEREKRSAGPAAKPPWWNSLAQMLPNISTASPLGDWWGTTAGIGMAGGGLYGGWKLTDWLLDRERESTEEGEVTDAKADYQKALASQYRQAMQAKHAGDALGIDDLYDRVAAMEGGDMREKLAYGLNDIFNTMYSPFGHDNVQGSKGALVAAMALLAGGTGLATYNYTTGRSKQEIMNRAMRLRERQRAAKAPAPIYTTVTHAPTSKDDEADELQYG